MEHAAHEPESPLRPPDGFLDRLRANPERAAETLAVVACQRHAPAAAAWARETLRENGGDVRAAVKEAKRIHARYSRFEGAALGVGGFVTILPDLLALAWIQARLACFVAAATGYDPTDELRPAELLFLHGVYPTPDEAAAAIAGEGKLATIGYATRSTSKDEGLAMRLGRMAGKRVAKRAIGRVVPFLGAITGAVGNERDTRRFADDAARFYLG